MPFTVQCEGMLLMLKLNHLGHEEKKKSFKAYDVYSLPHTIFLF